MPDVIERGAMAFAFSVYRADSPRGAETAETVWRDLIDEADRANFRRDIRAALQAALDPTDEALVRELTFELRQMYGMVPDIDAKRIISALRSACSVPNEEKTNV